MSTSQQEFFEYMSETLQTSQEGLMELQKSNPQNFQKTCREVEAQNKENTRMNLKQFKVVRKQRERNKDDDPLRDNDKKTIQNDTKQNQCIKLERQKEIIFTTIRKLGSKRIKLQCLIEEAIGRATSQTLKIDKQGLKNKRLIVYSLTTRSLLEIRQNRSRSLDSCFSFFCHLSKGNLINNLVSSCQS
ncbi:unnamed protein product (macronuclear) [Paramecium tetraurelia]|uniref:Uncharacterized protein n=1 Tax=Paramecium tetraurelia TaxID=5888 RepID=A0DCU8_PARTE|nr:uncharacterized protein GSPATT00015724001 [Paramecium tetraurelia]CAK80865.1 unnamed protein product [Paramecium tetraurelia]|eukprot:XP_001448262.1 hypothetical protein (macronuclear) [Paramecium tetraurelia strain d4-2]